VALGGSRTGQSDRAAAVHNEIVPGHRPEPCEVHDRVGDLLGRDSRPSGIGAGASASWKASAGSAVPHEASMSGVSVTPGDTH